MHRLVISTALSLLVPAGASAQAASSPAPAQAAPAVQRLTVGGFAVEHSITVHGTPMEVWNVLTGDILPWWDHRFKENAVRLYLEPKPGGCFCEIFDAEGNGARHAVVTYVEPGKTIRFEGPLGLTGNAISLVNTYELAQQGDSTKVTVKSRAAGEMRDGWPEAVNGVWRHFLVEAFKPYYERTHRPRS